MAEEPPRHVLFNQKVVPFLKMTLTWYTTQENV